MKTVNDKKSLLLASGLLLICLYLMYLPQPEAKYPAANAGSVKIEASAHLITDSGNFPDYIPGDIFPVLKNFKLL